MAPSILLCFNNVNSDIIKAATATTRRCGLKIKLMYRAEQERKFHAASCLRFGSTEKYLLKSLRVFETLKVALEAIFVQIF